MDGKTLLARRSWVLIASLGFLFATGCTTFKSEWDAAAHKPVRPESLSGRWGGTWASDARQDTGALRCVIMEDGSGAYKAHFDATYGGVFHGDFVVTLITRERHALSYFEGDSDLGAMAGGVYHYQGHANASDFFCTYKSKEDHGHFTMARVDVEPAPTNRPAAADSEN